METSLVQRSADFFHHRVVEIEVMEDAEAHAQHFLRFQQMANVSPAVALAGGALAAFLNRPLVTLVFLVEEVHLAMVGVEVAMAAIAARVYAVKKIHAPGYAF